MEANSDVPEMALAATQLRQMVHQQKQRQGDAVMATVLGLTGAELVALIQTAVITLAFPEHYPDMGLARGTHDPERLRVAAEVRDAMRGRKPPSASPFGLELDFAPATLETLVSSARTAGEPSRVALMELPRSEIQALILVSVAAIFHPISAPTLGIVKV